MRSDWERDVILQLPGNSVTSWIILREYINCHADKEAFVKILTDFRMACPLLEIERIMNLAATLFSHDDFQELVDLVFTKGR